VYAAAVVLHELLTGKNELRVPDSVEATIARIVQHVPSRVGDVRSDVPAALDDVLSQALAKDPASRHRDAAQLADALRALQRSSGDDLERHLSAAIEADFRDPRMATTLGVPDLATLDRAWRELPQEVVDFEVDVDVSPRSTEDMTVADPAPVRARRPRARRAVLGAAALAGVLAVAGAVAAFLHREGTSQTAAPLIVVNGQISGADGLVLDAASLHESAGGVSSVALDVAAGPISIGKGTSAFSPVAAAPARSDGVDGLTRAFSRQQPQVARCFVANAAEVTGTPEIAIRFGVDMAGRVTSAQVLPMAVGATPLGACLASVARATQFGPQSHEVSFRIPIVAHRAP